MEPVWEKVRFAASALRTIPPGIPSPTEEQIREILRMTNKMKPGGRAELRRLRLPYLP